MPQPSNTVNQSHGQYALLTRYNENSTLPYETFPPKTHSSCVIMRKKHQANLAGEQATEFLNSWPPICQGHQEQGKSETVRENTLRRHENQLQCGFMESKHKNS